MKKGTLRTRRQNPGRSRLMPRELAALAFIAKAQPVATPAYQEFLGVSVSVAQRSLRKLRNLGLITVHVSAMELPSHFTITKRAARLLSETSDQPLESKVPRGIGKLHLSHHDDGVFLYACLLRACRNQSELMLDRFEFETEIRQTLGLTRQTQIPDAVLVLKNRAGQRFAWAIEIDRGTESVRFVVERKAKPYAELHACKTLLAGVADWNVVCLVPNEQRLKRLVTALYEAGMPEGQWYFTTKKILTAQTVLTTAWRTVRTTRGGERAELTIEPPLPVSTACQNRTHRHHEHSPTETARLPSAKGAMLSTNPRSNLDVDTIHADEL